MENKVINEMDKGWYAIPNDFLNGYAKYVGWQGQIVYNALHRHSDKQDHCFPSIQHLAIELGVSVASIKRGIKKLRDWNIISVERRGKMQSNVYTLLKKSKWEKKPEQRWSNKKSDGSNRPIR